MMRRMFVILLLSLSLAILLVAYGSRQRGVEPGVTVLAKGGRYGQAVWSPDGESLAVLHTDYRKRIEVLSQSGQYIRTVASSVQVLSPGWLHGDVVFLDRGSEAEPARIMSSVNGENQVLAELPGAFYASWAVAAGSAVLKREDRGRYSLWHWSPGSQQLERFWSDGVTQRVKVSPDAHFVAFTNERSSTVTVYDLRTGTAQTILQVPSPGQALTGLVWSPDERYLGFNRTGAGKDDGFYVVEVAAPSNPVLLIKETLVDPDWHPKGDRIVYSTVGVPGDNELRVLSLPADWQQKVRGK